MPENNCSQKVLKRYLCGPMRHESWQKKVQKGISDSDELKYNLCVNAGFASKRLLFWSPLEYLFYLVFLFYYYINNDRSQVH